MGPFKHTVDDGLDIRKAAFECMYTLLEQGLDRVDIMQFLEHVQAGLKDHYDIKMLTYLMTARLAVLCPNAVIQSENLIIFTITRSLYSSKLIHRTGPVCRTLADDVHTEGQGKFGQARVRKARRTQAVGSSCPCRSRLNPKGW